MTTAPEPDTQTVVVSLGAAQPGTGGAIWSLPHGGDLDANLIRLAFGDSIGEHVNDEVDVVLVIQEGSGVVSVNEVAYDVAPPYLVQVPKGVRRSIEAGPSGLGYLSIHRRRGPLAIG